MNKAFEKILEKLEILKFPFPDECPSYCGNTNTLLDMAKQIVNQVAEEYISTEHINCSTNTSTNGWIPVKTRPMTEEEKEYYSEYLFESNGSIYECRLPEDGQEVLITSEYGGVDETTCYADYGN